MSDMTDDDREQLLSDVLDGAATPEEVARVRNDPELSAELAAIESAVGALATPPPPVPPARRESMIAAAMAEYDAVVADTPATTPTMGEPVVDLAAARARKQRRLNLMGAAAAVVLVVGAGYLALRGGSTDDADSTADGAAEIVEEAEMAEDDAMADEEAGEATAQAALPQAEGELERTSTLADSSDSGSSDAADLDGDEAEDDAASDVLEGEEEEAPAAIPLLPLELVACQTQVLEQIVDADDLVVEDIDPDGRTVVWAPGALQADGTPWFDDDQEPILLVDLDTCEVTRFQPPVPSAPDTSTPSG